MSRTDKILLFSAVVHLFLFFVSKLAVIIFQLDVNVLLFNYICAFIWSSVTVWILSKLMKRRWKYLLATILIIVSLLSLFTTWFGIVGYSLVYFGTIALILTLVLFLIQYLLKKHKSPKRLLLSSTLILIGTLSVLVGGTFTTPMPLVDEDGKTTFKQLHDTDQADRFSGHWIVDSNRDQQRLEYALAMVEDDSVLTPDEMFYAATILQHGTCADHFRIAHELATGAAENNVDVGDAKWLAEASFDRWQLALGNPQKYGTQGVPIPIERPCD